MQQLLLVHRAGLSSAGCDSCPIPTSPPGTFLQSKWWHCYKAHCQADNQQNEERAVKMHLWFA